jgi:hypothetical protein
MAQRKILSNWAITLKAASGVVNGQMWEKPDPVAFNPRTSVLTFLDGQQVIVPQREFSNKHVPYTFYGSIMVEKNGKVSVDDTTDIQPGDVWLTGGSNVRLWF